MSADSASEQGEVRPASQGRSYSEPELQELLPAYVLGALEPDEMLAVDEFLQTQPEWAARLHSLEMAAASLAHAAPRASLPARVRDQLLLQARAELPVESFFEPLPTTSLARRAPLLSTAPPAPRPSRGVRGLRAIPAVQPQPVATGPSWFGVFWRSVAAAGAVAAILLLAALTWQLRNTVTQLSNQVSLLHNQLVQVQAENAGLQQVNDSLQQRLQEITLQQAIFVDPDQTFSLAGTEKAPDASATFYRRGEDGVLILRGLQPLPAHQTYQLWILPADGGPSLPADLIEVDDPRAATVTFSIPAAQTNLVGLGVSVEPARGSSVPTDILLLGTDNAPSA